MKNNKEKQKERLLLAMYRSVERMNKHHLRGNNHGAMAESSLQVNLRHNFNELEEKEN